MTCSVAPGDFISGIQFAYYFVFTVVIYNTGLYSCWNNLWWGVINKRYGVPSHHTVFAFFTCVAVFEAWGAWRVWYCDGWVIHLLPLIFYIVMIACTSFYFIVFMLAPSIEYSALMAIAGIVMSILYTIFSYSPDVYAFVTGLVNIGICVMQLLLALRIYHDDGLNQESYRDYATYNALQIKSFNDTQQTSVTSDTTMDGSDQQSTPSGQAPTGYKIVARE